MKTPLQWSHARSVVLEEHGAQTHVVKRFRHPSRIGRLWDRGRARREFRWLQHLWERGVRVPEPLAVEHLDGAWAVRMQYVEGAVDLATLIANGAPWPAPRAAIAPQLGELVARMQSAGVAHPDLHPGNVLVDAAGRVWAIDFHHARAGQRDPAAMTGELVALEAALRERCSARFRRRALGAWFTSLPPALATHFPPLGQLARRIAADALPQRIRDVEQLARRWLRESEVCQRLPGPPTTLLRRGTDPALVTEWDHLAATGAQPDRVPHELHLAHSAGQDQLWAGPAPLLTEVWRTAARLEEHAIDAARPVALRSGPAGWLALRGEAGQALKVVTEDTERRSLLGPLEERGLELVGPLRVMRGPCGPQLAALDSLRPLTPTP